MEMNDKTILRIKVPANLYESVKAQLTLDEAKKGKQNLGAGMEVVKEKKSSGDKPKKAAAPKAEKPKKAKASKMDDDIPHDGMKKMDKKERSLEELMKIYEMLGERIAEMEKGDKKPVEEKKTVDKSKEEKIEEAEYTPEKINAGDKFVDVKYGQTMTSRMGTVDGPWYEVIAVHDDGTYDVKKFDTKPEDNPNASYKTLENLPRNFFHGKSKYILQDPKI